MHVSATCTVLPDACRPSEVAALAYLARGLSVIPVRGNRKEPLIPWKEFQVRRPTEAEVRRWYRQWPLAGVAIVCGVSNLIVLDGDPRNGDGLAHIADRLPLTPTVETGGGGRHCYFRSHGPSIPKLPALLPGLDLQAEGSYAIAPPSLHPSGRAYRWLPGRALDDRPLAPLPPLIRSLIAIRSRRDEARSRPLLRRQSPTLEEVLGALDGVRRGGRGWVARCPAHPDTNPSLSIGVGTRERGLLHCFRGCAFGAILDALRGATI